VNVVFGGIVGEAEGVAEPDDPADVAVEGAGDGDAVSAKAAVGTRAIAATASTAAIRRLGETVIGSSGVGWAVQSTD
jgi:hypothetical protein